MRNPQSFVPPVLTVNTRRRFEFDVEGVGVKCGLLILILCVFGLNVRADEAAAAQPPAAVESDFANPRNFVTAGVRLGNGFGPTFAYARKLNGQLLVGGSLSYDWSNQDSSGGSLDNAQYYDDHFNVQMMLVDANAAYFFRDEGVERRGWFVRGGLGYASIRGAAGWGRYDRNPAFFTFFGDDKRLLDSGSDDHTIGSAYVRAGLYYQFAWHFQSGHATGHKIELGAGGTYLLSNSTWTYTRDDGQTISNRMRQMLPLIEANYVLAF